MLRREVVRGDIVTAAAIRGWAEESPWGAPVLDSISTFIRDHLEGSGVRRAIFLPAARSDDRATAVMANYPDRFVRFTNADLRTAPLRPVPPSDTPPAYATSPVHAIQIQILTL